MEIHQVLFFLLFGSALCCDEHNKLRSYPYFLCSGPNISVCVSCIDIDPLRIDPTGGERRSSGI